MRLMKVCQDIEYRGVLIDRSYVGAAFLYEEAQKRKAIKDFEADTGRAFSNSSKLFAEIFTSRNEAFPSTLKGNPSFTGDFLDQTDTPTARLINKVRFHDKRISTYFKNFLYYVDKEDYLHPSMNQAGTVTGRFSYSNPNLQNVPKEDQPEDQSSPSNIRRSFIAPDGHFILSIDYAAVEYRIMLDYAGEESLIRAVRDGVDVHQATAEMLGIPRKEAKTLNFGLLYGIGAAKLGKALNLSEQGAKDLRNTYFKRLPKVSQFLKEVKYKAEDRGYVVNPFGRRYYCSDYKYSYKIPNHLIQGTSADVIKKAMVDLHEFLLNKKTRMVLQVHDELMFYMHKDEEDLIPGICSIMEQAYTPMSGLDLKVAVSKSDSSWSYWDLK